MNSFSPFVAPTSIAQVRGALTPDSIRAALTDKGREGRETLARLWLTEGVPAAFASCPALFDQVRVWLARTFQLSPKAVTIVGSARAGFSLAPPPRFGAPFGSASDLDLAIVSEGLFDLVASEFAAFKDGFASGALKPRSERELAFWRDNAQRVPQNLRAGFVDTKYIPNHTEFAVASKIAQSMWLLVERLKVTPAAPVPTRASIRVYKDWESAVERISFNLSRALGKDSA